MTRRLSIAKASVDELATLRQFVRQSVADFGGSQRTSDDLVQAVDEAACNVILHGYRGKPGELDVEATVDAGRIAIRILDRAPVFDPTAAPELDTTTPPEPPRPGNMGVGIHLARTMTDEVRHDVRPGGGNELTLIHSIDGTGEED